jgi:signal transduction histidine kinase
MHDVRRRPRLVGRTLDGPLTGPLLGVGCVAVSVAGMVLALGPGGRTLGGLLHDNVLNNVVNGVSLGLLAAALTRLRPGNRVGWLLLGIAWCNAVAVAGEGWALASYHLALPGRTAAAWLGSWPWVVGLLLGPTLLPLLYPTGRTTTRAGHRLAVALVVAVLVVGGCLALLDTAYDGTAPGHHLGVNPLSRGHLQPPIGVVAGVAAVAALVLGVVAWGRTVRRLWRAQSPEREQLAWLLALAVPLLLVAPLNLPWLTFAVQAVSPVFLLVGIVRHDLFDIKLLLSSGLLYGALTAIAVGAYFGVVALISTMTPHGTVPSLFAAATVALVVVPLHRWLQRCVGRLVYGDRSDPVRALARVARGMRGTVEDPTGLRPMLAGVAEALRSPSVAVTTGEGEVLAAVGVPPAGHRLHRVALEHAGESVGRLDVAARTARDRLSGRDRRLLEALAGPVAAAVSAGLLAREVEASRSRILAVRQAERARLRADLHDGLGPSLSGVALGLEAAESSVSVDPGRVAEMLPVLRREVDALVTEVRGIIDDLGPTQVDLVAAVRGQVESLVATGRTVAFSCTGPVDDLAGDVAVAAQRIAGEALSNAVRHAQATRISVSLTARPGALTVEVGDDGSGAVAPREGGVGLDSMRRRAEAVGGLLRLTAVPGAGTTVVATLPLGAT